MRRPLLSLLLTGLTATQARPQSFGGSNSGSGGRDATLLCPAGFSLTSPCVGTSCVLYCGNGDQVTMECPGGGLDITSTTNPDGSLSVTARCGQKFDPPACFPFCGDSSPAPPEGGPFEEMNRPCFPFCDTPQGPGGGGGQPGGAVVDNGGGQPGGVVVDNGGVSVGSITSNCQDSNCDVTYGGDGGGINIGNGGGINIGNGGGVSIGNGGISVGNGGISVGNGGISVGGGVSGGASGHGGIGAVGGGAGQTVVSSAGGVTTVHCQNFSGNSCLDFSANGGVGGGTSGATDHDTTTTPVGDGNNSVGSITTNCTGSNCDVNYGGAGNGGAGNGGSADGGAGAGHVATVNCQNISNGKCINYDNIETGDQVNDWGK